MDTSQDQQFMKAAIAAAALAEEAGDVPIGAVVVHEGKIIGRAWNQREFLSDPTAHAEIIALGQAASVIGGWRLCGCSMYVTLEPCVMCAGALVLARIDRLVFGPMDPKAGACGSLYEIVRDGRLNHRVEVVSGVMEDECSRLLQDFFRRR